MLRVVLLGMAFSLPAWAKEAPCRVDTPLNAFCVVPIDAVRPTQSAVGELQVAEDVAKLEKLKHKKRVAWQEKRVLPVVMGPDGGFYLTDRHHTSRSLWRVGEKALVVKVIGKLPDAATFWAQMQARHWVYLYDERGQPINPARLPRRIADLRDDPYRALAGFAEDLGYYLKTNAYFMQFEWARYYGQAMNWQPIDAGNLKEALRRAQALSCAPAARTLPGFNTDGCAAASALR